MTTPATAPEPPAAAPAAAPPAPAPAHAPVSGPPAVRALTVLHDPACTLCRHLTAWLRGSAQLVRLDFVAVASAEARARFPGLDHDASLGEITVVADTGEVWRGAHAFVVCLWALAEHRPLAQRLATPAGLPLARAAAFAASKYRQATGAGRAVPGAEGAPGPVLPGGPPQQYGAGGLPRYPTPAPAPYRYPAPYQAAYPTPAPYPAAVAAAAPAPAPAPAAAPAEPGCGDGSCPAPPPGPAPWPYR